MLPRAAVQSLSLFPSDNSSESNVTLSDDEIRSLAARFGSPLMVVDCEQVRRQYHSLKAALPGVDLHYALKPLPHVAVFGHGSGLWSASERADIRGHSCSAVRGHIRGNAGRDDH